jgi:hypothetical protein
MKITFGFLLESFSTRPGSSQYDMGAMRPSINIGAHVKGYDLAPVHLIKGMEYLASLTMSFQDGPHPIS